MASGPAPLLALAAVLVLAGCVSPPADRDPVRSAEGRIRTDDGVALHYRTVGGRGDTIVVVHGGPFADHGYLWPELEPLAATHVLVFYDQRGTGRSSLVSDPSAVTVASHIADLEAVRRHFGLRRMTLLGHSWGALLAAGYARQHPDAVAALIAVSPSPLRRDPYAERVMPRVTAWMDSATLAEVVARDAARRDPAGDARATCRAFYELLVRGALADPSDVDVARRVARGFCGAPAPALRNQLRVDSLTLASLGAYDWRDRFRASRFPVLVLAGASDVDPVEAYREWVGAFPDARLVRLDGAGHFSYIERPDAFTDAVANFLARVWPPPPGR
jgi:proline iminopeptidase